MNRGYEHLFGDFARPGTDTQVGKEAGKPYRPQREIVDSGPDASAGTQVVEDSDQKTEVAFVGFVRRQQLLRDLSQIVECDARFVVRGQRELRMNQLAGVQTDQLAVLLLIIRHGGMGEAFESGAKGVLGTAGSAGDAAEFALIAREEANDEVGFTERVSLEDEGFARASGHWA